MISSRITGVRVSFRRVEVYFLLFVFLAFAFASRGLTGVYGQTVKSLTLLLMVGLYGLLLLLMSREQWLYFHTLQKVQVLLLFNLVVLLSVLWSLEPAETLEQGLLMTMTTLVGIYFASKYDYHEYIRLVFYIYLTIAILSLLAIYFVPWHGRHSDYILGESWRGLFFNKGHLGRQMSIGVLLTVFAIDRKLVSRLIGLPALALMVLLLWNSNALAPRVTCLALISVYFLLRGTRFQLSVRLMTILILLLGAAASALYIATNFEDILQVIGKDVTLTNRTRIWAYSIQSVLQRPILGYGYESFWFDEERVRGAIQWISPHAHNHFLDLLLGVGLVGGSLFLLAWLKILLRSYQKLMRERRVEYTWPLLSTLLLTGITFTSILINYPNNAMWVVFVANYAYVFTGKIEMAPTHVLESQVSVS